MKPATVSVTPATPDEDHQRADQSEQMAAEAMRCLEDHPHFQHRTGTFRIDDDHGRLIISGRLPSFHLMQLLQEAVRRIDGVEAIDNRVEVTSCNGLSSVNERIAYGLTEDA